MCQAHDLCLHSHQLLIDPDSSTSINTLESTWMMHGKIPCVRFLALSFRRHRPAHQQSATRLLMKKSFRRPVKVLVVVEVEVSAVDEAEDMFLPLNFNPARLQPRNPLTRNINHEPGWWDSGCPNSECLPLLCILHVAKFALSHFHISHFIQACTQKCLVCIGCKAGSSFVLFACCNLGML